MKRKYESKSLNPYGNGNLPPESNVSWKEWHPLYQLLVNVHQEPFVFFDSASKYCQPTQPRQRQICNANRAAAIRGTVTQIQVYRKPIHPCDWEEAPHNHNTGGAMTYESSVAASSATILTLSLLLHCWFVRRRAGMDRIQSLPYCIHSIHSFRAECSRMNDFFVCANAEAMLCHSWTGKN